MNADKVFKLAKGFVGRAKNCWRIAKPKVEKGLQYAYIARRLKKRLMRKVWIGQINAATRQYGMIYSQFVHQLVRLNVGLNRKMLAELAVSEPYSFHSIVTKTQEAAPWRDWRATQQSGVPQRLTFLPLPWSFAKEQMATHAEMKLEAAAEKAAIPKQFKEQFFRLFAEPIRKAEEQNKKDLAAGKLKVLKPVWQMPAKERQAFLKERWAASLKKREQKRPQVAASRAKSQSAIRNASNKMKNLIQRAEKRAAADATRVLHKTPFQYQR